MAAQQKRGGKQDNLKAAKKATVKQTGIINNTKGNFDDETELFIAFK